MKSKITFKEKGKVIKQEKIIIRDNDHFLAQQKFPAIISKSKKDYKRKQKHKENLDE
jgi:hypothetical protein